MCILEGGGDLCILRLGGTKTPLKDQERQVQPARDRQRVDHLLGPGYRERAMYRRNILISRVLRVVA